MPLPSHPQFWSLPCYQQESDSDTFQVAHTPTLIDLLSKAVERLLVLFCQSTKKAQTQATVWSSILHCANPEEFEDATFQSHRHQRSTNRFQRFPDCFPKPFERPRRTIGSSSTALGNFHTRTGAWCHCSFTDARPWKNRTNDWLRRKRSFTNR